MRIYLCSRCKPEYHAANERVAQALEAAGHKVFVPHRADQVDPTHRTNPFPKDFAEMRDADHCVIVGPIGVDCATELGWFAGAKFVGEQWLPCLNPSVTLSRELPSLFMVLPDAAAIADFTADHPMAAGFVTEYFTDLNKLVERLYK